MAQEVQLGAANGPLALDFDFGDPRRVKREHPLDTLAVGNAADGEIGIQSKTLATDHDAGINLDTLFVAFDNACVNFDGVTDLEVSDILL